MIIKGAIKTSPHVYCVFIFKLNSVDEFRVFELYIYIVGSQCFTLPVDRCCECLANIHCHFWSYCLLKGK